ncbi:MULTISPECIES: RAMP superfamily CRISPR-associated protein [unclassified Microcoleus]|uniref:RAMP superfamily CRISPR-associated protein n=1 Tax=unclassified Microcoleus TaxID=2642155 RepID=UPI002FD078B5
MTELRHKSNRHIIKRIIVRGTLVLDTPTSLGSGDADSPIDLPLLRDSISNHALLTGSSIGGALRNYLRERKKGYQESDRRYDLAAKLFGDLFAYKDEKDKSEKEKIKLREQDTQSLLIIDDAIGTKPIKAELRDGVKINGGTGTAEDKAKYDLELLQAGTEFPLSFELLVEREANEADLLKGLAIALSGLEKGEISLGMKKRRGFGRCKVHNWQVWNFNLEDPGDRMAWLTLDHSWLTDPPCSKPPAVDASIVEAMKQAGLEVAEDWEDKRDRFLIHATFKLAGSLLIRSGQDSTGRAPDVVHLKSHRHNETNPVSVLSGTSLAGVLRHRAERIINTLEKPTSIIDEVFGPDFSKDKSKQAKASRLVVHEKVIKDATELVQNRIAIDRFTGGAYHGALFEEQPIFGGDKTIVTIELELRNPYNHEIGLLLLLLKDLWTSDLPVGGESSIGRGRLQGKNATLTQYIWDREKKLQHKEVWTINQTGEKEPLVVSDSGRLEKFFQKLVNYPTEVLNANE